ncbi:NADH:ubiquinone oxidoreductase [Bacillus sp. AR8-1]|uniref:NADH:ubiquinone oxidoreductase n=1 Tax=Bacillus sp. AR8-1 TaxID=2217826 RepID=UPI0011CCC2DA|nr:NADH:ubiquinone oxidoreductase [Bacillus sp. AR8-1]TXR64625.1 NADH:ubiquinone oxidoreductase [Bacillus sp. AR8-1]
MYQNWYSNPYSHTYTDDMYRDFASKIGSFFTILNNVPISGGAIPAGTRVFIHNVVRDAGGNEIVTIVFPQMGPGGCIARSTNVYGSSLEAPAPIQQIMMRDQY